MKRHAAALVFAFLFAAPPAPLFSQEKAEESPTPLGYLEGALGSQTVKILEDRGYIVVAGRKESRKVVHIQWDALALLVENRGDLQTFIQSYDGFPESDAADLQALRRLQPLPAGGLLTPALHTAVDVLAARLRNTAALPKAAAGEPSRSAFLTPWGERFREEASAELAVDFKPLAEDYFRRYLSRPEAADHFTRYLKDIHQADIGERLGADFAEDRFSDELQGRIVTYLSEQQRLWNLHETPKRLKRNERGSHLGGDLRDLRGLLPAIAGKTDFIKELRRTTEKPDERARIRFRGTEIHIHTAGGASTQDTGDEAVVSMAYWIEGLEAEEKTDVVATGFVDELQRGISGKTVQSSLLGQGGPYTFSARVKLTSHDAVKYRFYLSARNAETFSAEATVGVSPAFKTVVAALADAQRLVSQCRLNKAQKSLEDARDEAAALAQKGQFKSLLKDIGAELKKLERMKEARSQLKDSLDSVTLFASPEHCDYQTDRAERAQSLLEQLPPGCDQINVPGAGTLSQHVLRQRRLTDRRRQLQLAFRDGVVKARGLEKRCQSSEAAEMYASSLALLDSDPAARCGAWETEFESVRLIDLPRAVRASSVGGEIDGTIARAEKSFGQGHYAKALSILHPLIRGIDTLHNSSCYSARRENAEKAAQAAGIALYPPASEGLKEFLPGDPVAESLENVRRASRLLREEQQSQQEVKSSFERPNAPKAKEMR